MGREAFPGPGDIPQNRALFRQVLIDETLTIVRVQC